jgi:cellulose synthase (UDP-forming)
MLAVQPLLAACAGAAIIIGLRLLLLPQLDPRHWLWRTLLLGGASFLAWRYMVWRFTDTLAPFSLTADGIFSWLFAILEALTIVSSTSAFIILTRVRDRSEEADAHAQWWEGQPTPKVDVYIATYNEVADVLERTIVGAKRTRYANLAIHVLDDARRPWLKELCDRHGVGYRTRADNDHAKAGNLNAALMARLAERDPPDFVAVLDADFIPHLDFVSRALALFHDPRVGVVQTPQHFFNPDPIQHNLGISSAYPDEQRHFFDNVEPARDAWGIAVCCGTSSIARVAALQEIGGFPTESVTEDFLLTLRLSERGWATVYLNEPLTEGLAPEGLREYVVQRGRWCLGMMQIARNVYNPFASHGLSFVQRFSIVDSVLYWTTTFPFRLAGLVCPLLYWWFGITVVNASVTDVIIYYVPYYIAVIGVLNWLSKGLFIPILNDVAQLVTAWPITRAATLGLLSRGPHKFTVTAKGGDRRRVVVQWPMMLPFLVLFGLTAGGLIVTLISDFIFNNAPVAGDGMAVVMFWTLYNLVVLLVAIAACIERPRPNRPQRQDIEAVTLYHETGSFKGWLINLGVEGARVTGPPGLAPGDPVRLHLPDIGEMPGEVAATTDSGYRLRTRPQTAQRDLIIARLHTVNQAPGTRRGNIGLMIRELARTLTR